MDGPLFANISLLACLTCNGSWSWILCYYSKLKKHFFLFSSRTVSKIKFDFKDNKAQIRGRYEIIFVGNSGGQMLCNQEIFMLNMTTKFQNPK